MMMGSADDAIAYIERELEVVPDHAQAWLNLAALRLLTREFDKSEAAAKTLLEKDPKNWEAWFHLGNLYEAVPAEKEAEDAYRKAAALSKDNWKVLMNLGALLVQSESKGKNAEAVSLLEKTLPLAPKGEWRPAYNLALAWVRVGRRAEALELAQKIQKEAPPDDPMVAEAKKLESNLKEAKA
jgi:Flp pilus assembly protein TadD